MTCDELLKQLESLGRESIKKTLLRHGIREPLYGVKIEELQKIRKKIKKDNALAMELYASGVYDAMYLAGLIAEPEKMSKGDLQKWAQQANAPILRECTVAWVTSESNYATEMAMKWIGSADEGIASAGWATLSSIVAITDDTDLDTRLLKQLLGKIPGSIHGSSNRVKSAMNSFVISPGTYVMELNEPAKQTAQKIGKLSIDVVTLPVSTICTGIY